MATPESFIFDRLTGDTVLNSLVGGRVAPHPAPLAVDYPLITYQRTATQSLRHLAGAASIRAPRFYVNIWAREFAQTVEIGDAVLPLLDGFSDRQNGIQSVELANIFDDYEEDERVFRRTIEIVIWHDT